MYSDEYKIGELVKVRLFGFGIGIQRVSHLSYPYFSYGIVLAQGLSSYDDKEGYFVFVQKLQKIEFFKVEWMKKVVLQGEKNEPNV